MTKSIEAKEQPKPFPLTPKTLSLLELCLENGIARGYMRAHKHTNEPEEERLKQTIQAAVMEEFYEWFDFEGDED